MLWELLLVFRILSCRFRAALDAPPLELADSWLTGNLRGHPIFDLSLNVQRRIEQNISKILQRCGLPLSSCFSVPEVGRRNIAIGTEGQGLIAACDVVTLPTVSAHCARRDDGKHIEVTREKLFDPRMDGDQGSD